MSYSTNFKVVCGKRRSGEECTANKRIIDGQDADDNCVEWPWMVSLANTLIRKKKKLNYCIKFKIL